MASYDPTDLRGQEQKKLEAEARERFVRDMETADIRWLMSSKRGRRIMWRLLSLSGVTRLSFDANAMKMAFAEGRRALGNELLNEVMKLCPEMWPVMVKEQRDDRDSNGNPSK